MLSFSRECQCNIDHALCIYRAYALCPVARARGIGFCIRYLGTVSALLTLGVAEPSAKLEQHFAVLFGFGANPLSGLCLVGRTQCTPLGYATVLSMICVWVNTCVDSHKSANASCTHGIGVVALLGQATTHLIAQCLVGPRGCPLCGIQATTRRQRIEPPTHPAYGAWHFVGVWQSLVPSSNSTSHSTVWVWCQPLVGALPCGSHAVHTAGLCSCAKHDL